MRLWMFGIPSLDYADFLLEHGFRDVVVGYNPELIRGLLDRGLNVHIVLGVFKLGREFRDPRYLAEDPYGRKHIWFGSGCPNNPEIRRRTLSQIVEIVRGYGNPELCKGCSRVRLTHDGKLKPCLYRLDGLVDIAPFLKPDLPRRMAVTRMEEALREVNKRRRPFFT